MPDFSKYSDKAKDLLSENQDKVDEGAQKGGDFVDEKTGGKYSEQIDGAQEKAGEMTGSQGDAQQGEEQGEQGGGESGQWDQGGGSEQR